MKKSGGLLPSTRFAAQGATFEINLNYLKYQL